MPTGQQHIIRRQVLRVDVHGTERDALALQHRLSDLCRKEISSALEQMLERTVPADEHWVFDRMEIDAGTIELDDLENGLAEALTSAMEKRLGEQAPAAPRQPAAATPREPDLRSSDFRRSDSAAVHEAFLHFLKTGSLPWWFHLSPGTTLEQVVMAAWTNAGEPATGRTYFANTMLDSIASVPAQQRLVRQFSQEFREIALMMLSPEGAGALAEVLAKLDETPGIASDSTRALSRHLWQTAFARTAAGRPFKAAALIAECRRTLPHPEPQLSVSFERLARHWPAASNAAAARDSAEAGPRREDNTDDPDVHPEIRLSGEGETPSAVGRAPRREAIERIDLKEGAYVGSAGLVLLHPFLPRFFEALGIAAEGRLLQPERALCLLHFLATGQRTAPEHELLLPKLLCNLPFEEPSELSIDLTATEEDESAALLNAVVGHWDALGGTSADGLRGTFLRRAGKLSGRADGDYLLQVEAQSFDILLDRLPWSVSIVKLPWMERQLWVEWR